MSRAYSLKYPAEIKENMYFAIETFAGHPKLAANLPPRRERPGFRQRPGGLHADGAHGRSDGAVDMTTATRCRLRFRISRTWIRRARCFRKSAPNCVLAEAPRPKPSWTSPARPMALLVTYAKITAEMIRADETLPDHLALRHRRRQCGHRRRHGKGHRRHQGARLLHRRSFRPRHGAASCGGAQDPVLPMHARMRDAGKCPPSFPFTACAEAPWAWWASAAFRNSWRRRPSRLACTSWPTIRTSRRKLLGRAGVEKSSFAELREALRLHFHSQPADAGDPSPFQRRRFRADEADRLPGQHGARSDRR